MAAAAKDTGQLLGVAYFRRLFPKLMKTKRLIAEGIIGQPILAESNCHSWLNISGREWAIDPAMAGGGPLYDIGSHRIDALNFLFGQPLKATGLRSNAVHQMDVEDSATVMIEYAGGCAASLTSAGIRASRAISSACWERMGRSCSTRCRARTCG